MTPNWRRPAGALAIIALICVWCMLVVALAPMIGRWHWAAQLIFYLVAGIVWIAPLRPLLVWMQRNR